jgi:uncharacterized protein
MTRISVSIKPNAKFSKVERKSGTEFTLWVKAPAREGRANLAAIDLLSEYLDIPKSKFTIARGHTARNKVIDIA